MFDNHHFFYSAKQAGIYKNHQYLFGNSFPSPINYALIDGKEVLYTTVSETMEHGCTWDDMTYLGQGKYSHSEGTW